MKKYKCGDGTMPAGEYYDVIDVDARIAKLERALKCCSFVLTQMLKKDEALGRQAREALNDADKVLSL